MQGEREFCLLLPQPGGIHVPPTEFWPQSIRNLNVCDRSITDVQISDRLWPKLGGRNVNATRLREEQTELPFSLHGLGRPFFLMAANMCSSGTADWSSQKPA